MACSSRPQIEAVALTDIKGAETHINPKQNALTVIYFLSPECPLCINYSLAMRQLEETFTPDRVKFYGIYAKEWYSPQEVDSFALKYHLGFPMLFDQGNRMAQVLGATVTPEVFVIDQKGTIRYSGKIDNWVNDLGKKKLEVSDHYLENALLAFLSNQPINPNHTEPIGCLIE